MNDWLSATMQRHQIIQLPAMFGLGFVLGTRFSRLNIKENFWGISVLIFTISFISWVLPRSIGNSVISTTFNRMMHLNMIVAGILLMPVLRNILFEIKFLFLGMMSAMMLATGIT
jgi:hypothetical protein